MIDIKMVHKPFH